MKPNMHECIEAIEAVLPRVVTEWEMLGDPTEEGAVWGFDLEEDDASGFVVLESNQGTYDVPTVSVALSLGPVSEADRDEVLDMLAVSAQLLDACMTITPPIGEEGEEYFLIQTKFLAKDFSEARMIAAINSLVTQLEMFFGGRSDA